VKFPGEAAERLARSLLSVGPGTATELADRLGMTPAGVRRVLALLMEESLVEAHERAPYGPAPKPRRGRPSSVYALTDTGRAACDQAYDDLALSALTFMAESFGVQAVESFANARASKLAEAMRGSTTAQEVALALTKAGYAADVEPLGEVAVQQFALDLRVRCSTGCAEARDPGHGSADRVPCALSARLPDTAPRSVN
jgi:predicted ArsR family transcriptional regulator